MKHGNLYAIVFFLTAMLFVAAAWAQEPLTPAPGAVPADESAVPSAAATVAAEKGPFMQSFLFTPAEVSLIRRAREGVVTGSAILNAGKTVNIPAVRVISLAGVVYRGPGDWIIWLNGQKVTPGRLLPEIVDIKVSNDRVTLKWFDIGLNDVIGIELHPHQVYDIVTGVLLPG